MILPASTKNFDSLAEQTVKKFMMEGAVLNKAIIDVANASKLNPIELQRLVEKTNTLATVKMLQASKDKKVEFDLADYEKILAEYLDEKDDEGSMDNPVIKTASFNFKLPNTRLAAKVKDVPLPTLEKVAQEKVEPLQVTIFKLKKIAEEHKLTKMATELKVEAGIDYLISEFEIMNGPDFGKFASEVYTHYGSTSAPILHALAKSLAVPQELTKVAYTYEADTKHFAKFASVYDNLKTLVATTQHLAATEKELAETWSRVGA